ncbi:hypothetical protein Mia14_0264 [Candidatus Mancarchaeum acidiphilum]|uniref:Uncharacterized protein n=1 Tax=Candidatus Mancarchaeum acidiphilum TaxID=1920749 RepID=A0A218NMA5_9ARCH|nr:hypothetical protein [Candidatus Mancarchaeum acidiphilum]ASI13594.1 hypothetical protein Mia14_0264 [Candidatus Mancarchaeum acidiphilum]
MKYMFVNQNNDKSDCKNGSFNSTSNRQILDTIYKKDKKFINSCYLDILEKSFEGDIRITKSSDYLFEISKKFVNQAIDSTYKIFTKAFPDFAHYNKGQIAVEKFDYKGLRYKDGEYEASGIYKNGTICINMDYLIKDEVIAIKRLAKKYKSKEEFIEALKSNNTWGNNLMKSLLYLYSTTCHEVFHHLQYVYVSPNIDEKDNPKSNWLYIEGSASYFDNFMMHLLINGPDTIIDNLKYSAAQDLYKIAKNLDGLKNPKAKDKYGNHHLGSALFSIISCRLDFDIVEYLKFLKILSSKRKLSDNNLISLIEKEYGPEFDKMLNVAKLKR